MKRIFVISFLLLSSLPLIGQTTPVKPLQKKVVVAKLESDFKAFSKKIAVMNFSKSAKAKLANDYSDLIDRIDQQFHSPRVQKNNDRTVSSMKSSKTRIDH